MLSQKDKYEKHVSELATGVLRNNRKKVKKMKYDKKKLVEIVKGELSYSTYLKGRRVKKITINGMSFTRNTKLSDPSNFQEKMNINKVHF